MKYPEGRRLRISLYPRILIVDALIIENALLFGKSGLKLLTQLFTQAL